VSDNKWLEDLRIKNNWTQEKVASMVEVHRSYIAKIEAGQTPSVKVAKKLGKIFGFPWEKFFNEICDDVSHISTGTDG